MLSTQPLASFQAGELVAASDASPLPAPHKNEAGLPSTGREDYLLGVEAALKFAQDGSVKPARSIYNEYSLANRVAFVTGGNGGLGLEMALALCEAGAVVHCLDLPASPSTEFAAAAKYAEAFGGRLEYVSGNVTDQDKMRAITEEIANREGSLDICVAAAGILGQDQSCLELELKDFEKIVDVNLNGVFVTAAACGRQMKRLNRPGSIILIASMSGSITNRDHRWAGYNASKSGVIQLARSMACELGPCGIRVNSLSPGHIRTAMTNAFLSKNQELENKWSNSNPLGRLGKVHEMRGPVVWLASDASTFCTGSDIIVSGGHDSW